MGLLQILLVTCVCLRLSHAHNDNNVYRAEDNRPVFGPAKEPRYLLYDVNPREGFNLRRDVYIRFANLVKFLNEEESWVLVLPVWYKLYHWQSPEISNQNHIPWSEFFDLESLSLYIPVIGFKEYLRIMGKPVIEEVYFLQRYAERWTKWVEKMDVEECIEPPPYHRDEKGLWRGPFFGMQRVYAKKFACLSVQTDIRLFKTFLLKNTTAHSVFVDRAESVNHGFYSQWSLEYWTARRSMVFAKRLRDAGDAFRSKFLNSNEDDDKTPLDAWAKMNHNHGDAKGGPYLAVHLRRGDHLYNHPNQLPSIEHAAKQTGKYLKKHKLDTVFVATDAPDHEYFSFRDKLQAIGAKVLRYKPESQKVMEDFKDGGIAIIDQWICAHAKVFVGSYVSTFSYRIHEEREILGFHQNMTYNRLCGDNEPKNCTQPNNWVIKY